MKKPEKKTDNSETKETTQVESAAPNEKLVEEFFEVRCIMLSMLGHILVQTLNPVQYSAPSIKRQG